MPEIDSYNGVRSVIKFIAIIVKLYLKHNAACIAFLPSDVCAALTTLAGALATVEAINISGPN